MKARVMYQNDDRREGYLIEIYVDGEWGMESFFPLVKRDGASEDEERNFVHYGIINKIAELNNLGYTVTFM